MNIYVYIILCLQKKKKFYIKIQYGKIMKINELI